MRGFLTFWIAVALLSSVSSILHAQCAEVKRSGATATIMADTWRPMNAIAQTLANNYGVIISAEDPDLISTAEMADTTEKAVPEWRATHPGVRVYTLKPWRVQLEFRLRGDGTPEDVPRLLQDIINAANTQSPFAYRLDVDGEFNTFVPTQTRDEAGALVERTPLLDRRIDIPAGTRTIVEHGEMLAKALSAQTGLRVGCCQSLVAGVPWGMAKVSFEAHAEQARSVLERLIRLERQTEEQLKARSFSFNSNVHWLLNCDPYAKYCFIDLFPVGGRCP